jgi:hypothetical protein
MTARLLILPVIFTMHLAASVSSSGDKMPTAPPPRPAGNAKSPHELIVGTWRLMSVDGQAPRNDTISTLEFTRDGKLIYRYFSPRRHPRVPEVDSYRLEGNALSFSFPAAPENQNPAREYRGAIETISEDKLILIGNANSRDMPSQRSRSDRYVNG